MTIADSFTESISGEIRAQMARANITQKELALSIGRTQSQLSRRLTGRIAFTTLELELVARALRIPVTELVSPRAS